MPWNHFMESGLFIYHGGKIEWTSMKQQERMDSLISDG